MNKRTIKAFTLVEMLIVIVIIGILIASLMPRMQTAQGRARDVARKNDLSQIQTAIITSQSDRGEWPGMWKNKTATNFDEWKDASNGVNVEKIKDQLINAWMSEVPQDPNGSNVNFWVWDIQAQVDDNDWKYLYYVWKRNGVDDAWFVLMAKTEVEWSSNWVVCDGASDTKDLKHGYIKGDDLSKIVLCKSVSKTSGTCQAWDDAATWDWSCSYTETSQLRYILLY